MNPEALLHELMQASERRESTILATVAAVQGSVPHLAGAKALFFAD